MLDLVDPYGRYYGLPFRSQSLILDIILHDQLVLFDHSLLPFLLGYFFIARRICINDVTQQCHITALCLRPLSYFEGIVILFFILYYFLELSSLVLWNKSHPSFLVGDCTRYLLQLKFISCMVRNIS